MRITIATTEESAGFFGTKKQYICRCDVQFSDEELAIIKQRKLKDVTVYNMELSDGTPIPFTIGDILKRSHFQKSFPTPVGAKLWEQEVKTEILPGLKRYIDASSDIPDTPETLEL